MSIWYEMWLAENKGWDMSVLGLQKLKSTLSFAKSYQKPWRALERFFRQNGDSMCENWVFNKSLEMINQFYAENLIYSWYMLYSYY